MHAQLTEHHVETITILTKKTSCGPMMAPTLPIVFREPYAIFL